MSLRQHVVSAVAVVTNGARRHKHLRLDRGRPDGLHKRFGRSNPAVANDCAAGLCPAWAYDRFTSEIDHGVTPLDNGG